MVHAFVIYSTDAAAEGAFVTEAVPEPALLWWQCFTPAWNLPRTEALRALALVGQRVLADAALSLACGASFRASVATAITSSSPAPAPAPAPAPTTASATAPPAHSGVGSSAANPAAAAAAAAAVLNAAPTGVLRATVCTDAAPGPVESRAAEAAAAAAAGGAAALWTRRRTARVLWRAVPSLGAAACLVLEDGDALAPAQHVLAALVTALVSSPSGNGNGSSSGNGNGNSAAATAANRRELFEQRPEEVVALVDHLLPGGQLLVMPRALQNRLRRDAAVLSSSKT